MRPLALLRSTDAGASWTELVRIENAPVRTLAIDPRDTSTLYAGTIAGRGVFKSTDQGASWIPVNTGLPVYIPGPDQSGNLGDVTALAIDPANPSTVYAAFAHGGVYKSTDAGGSWRAQNSGLPSTFVSALALDPADPSTLYAAVYCGGGPVAPGFRCEGGIFKTVDAGASWEDASSGLQSLDVVHLAFAPADASVLYAGTSGGWIYKAADGGTRWTALHPGVYPGLSPTGVPALAVDPQDASVLYVGTLGGGVYKSSNTGATWTKASSGLRASVAALALDPTRTSVLFAGTAGAGVFRSDDAGASWKSGYDGLTNTFISSLAVHPSVPSTLYAVTGSGYGAAGAGLFRSTDSGASWTAAQAGLPQRVISLALHPADPATVFAGTSPYGQEGGTIFKSTDGGESWAAIKSGQYLALVAVPGEPFTLYATGAAGILKSTDAGENWTTVTLVEGKQYEVYGLAFDPAHPATLYATAVEPCGWCDDWSSLFKSTDAGETWSQINVEKTYLGRLVVDGSDSSVLYSWGFGVFKSTNGGETWSAAGLTNTAISGLVLDPKNSSTLYAATGRGVFKSTDAGATWIPTGSN
ncbi:MAG: hypothetical protein HYZ57_01055 [Acidobacteria bacterium]|nr:hypothetical protein [Acidobacteriota bacterium]